MIIDLDTKSEIGRSYRTTYAGFLFIGIFLSILFLAGCVLIMYYKQIAEGYQDKERFKIMEQIGMEESQIRSLIRFQVLSLFFLPLILAAMHIAFNFNIVSRLLLVFGLTNTSLFIWVTLACLGIFSILYFFLYSWTAKVYYQIIR
jgi:putative ABC transport system permease protein